MPISRRKALFLSLGAGAALGCGGFAAWRPPAVFAPVSRTAWALGSDVSITVHGLARAAAERALDAAFAELETVESVMSLYQPDSQVCRLNRQGFLDQPHPYLVQVLRAAESTSRQTDGALDITVQPLWDLHRMAKQQGRLPSDDELAAAKSRVDWRRVSVTAHRIDLGGSGTSITLNGIAQGFAADRARSALAAHGVQQALINTGEVASLGSRSAGNPWSVGIQHPRNTDAYTAVAALNGRSLATSGDYETTFTADFRTNHIFDPRTGRSPAELASVSIVAPTALEADALSTAAMVLGAEATLRLVERLPGVDALLVGKDSRTFRTPGFPEIG
jgi:thiamine biosynthesis lipoprotein